VAVVNSYGRYVAHLQAEDFAVYEQGVRQTVSFFATSSTPLDLMLLVDTSGSMWKRLDLAQQAATSFVRTLRSGDRAAVILFSDRVRVAQALTEDMSAVEAAIRDASAYGGTALHEALYIALRELARVQRVDGQYRRQALVVLTDGEDTTSRNVAFEDVLNEARRSALTVFTITPVLSAPVTPDVSVSRRADFGLRSLAEETGGRAFTPARSEDLSATYRQIAEELGEQYWIAYAPSVPARPGFRRVSVHVPTQPGLQARTRSGYYALAPRAVAVPTPERIGTQP
jgi:VWFA-related protein